MSFLFKGISSETYFIVEKVYRSILPPVENTSFDIAGKPGAYPQNTKLGIRKHDFVIRMRESNIDDLNGTIRAVASWLFSDSPGELILNKEPDKYYMAKLDGETDLEEIVRIGKGTLTFISEDPIAFDRVETLIPITTPETQGIAVGGTYKTFPVVRATFNKPATFFSYATENEYEQVLIGKPVEAGVNNPVPPETTIYSDHGVSMNGWSTTGVTVEDNTISGTMIATGDRYTYGSLGTGTGWHGPAAKRALSEPLNDYRVDVWFKFNLPNASQMARLELYLYDVNSNVIGKIQMYDSWTARKDTHGNIRLGNKQGHDMIRTHGVRAGVWNDFWGLLRLEKSGKNFKAYIGKVDANTKKHHTRWNATYYDAAGEYQADLAQIGMFIGGYANYPYPTTSQLFFEGIYVYKKNSVGEYEVPYIFDIGDILEFDHYTKAVLKNGEPFKQHLNPYTKMFSLEPGTTPIGFQPSDAANIEVSYRNRWL